MPDISVQLFSVREQATKDYEGTIRAIAAMGFTKVETAGFPGTTPAAAAKLFKELNISAPSCHCPLPVGDNAQQIIDDALTVGSKYLISGVPPGGRENFTGLDKVKAMADLYVEAANNVAKHGLQVGYHNHDWDLVEVEGKRAYQVLLERTPDTVLYEADLFWVTKAGLKPADFVKEIGVRGKCLHFKDGVMGDANPPFRPAGTGVVDLKGAAAVAKHTEIVAVELDRYDGDMMQAVQQSYTWLTKNGIAKGRI